MTMSHLDEDHATENLHCVNLVIGVPCTTVNFSSASPCPCGSEREALHSQAYSRENNRLNLLGGLRLAQRPLSNPARVRNFDKLGFSRTLLPPSCLETPARRLRGRTRIPRTPPLPERMRTLLLASRMTKLARQIKQQAIRKLLELLRSALQRLLHGCPPRHPKPGSRRGWEPWKHRCSRLSTQLAAWSRL